MSQDFYESVTYSPIGHGLSCSQCYRDLRAGDEYIEFENRLICLICLDDLGVEGILELFECELLEVGEDEPDEDES